ncbi:hypothetical protein ROA7745_04254 [Roseovarius aestuarii]|uniref:Uncharacterized protein n=1 Tax=Roseovarius aestuarii TaxID=475083 RepID=A0A1X7BXL1_9RHOB|nr:hypothetical protein ROA7745_04254 [Roseovarius aestuarii]
MAVSSLNQVQRAVRFWPPQRERKSLLVGALSRPAGTTKTGLGPIAVWKINGSSSLTSIWML